MEEDNIFVFDSSLFIIDSLVIEEVANSTFYTESSITRWFVLF